MIKKIEPQKPIITVKPTTNIPSTPAPAPKVVMDLSGVKVGATVKHKTFGDGIVAIIEGGKILVAFGTAEKAFIFPDAFENGFLRI